MVSSRKGGCGQLGNEAGYSASNLVLNPPGICKRVSSGRKSSETLPIRPTIVMLGSNALRVQFLGDLSDTPDLQLHLDI